ncbi:STAS domain-containing protein [Geodermatophilus saharensis]|uniref:STAS domain-containing protein n=1 Tax=Geodermatophilus saharensis TaxID=1137994 RepID=A0A239E9F0_9ACTN|nr:STAS domain-containing protein [Geodermatophilus saharensis]
MSESVPPQEGAAVEPPHAAGPHDGTAPEVITELDGDVSRVTVTGELTEAARRPLVRVVTDQLLSVPTLSRVELLLGGVTFMNSAGMAVLVQLQRMTQPRAVTVALVSPPAAVARPLQLTGLWRRFEVVDPDAGPADAGGSPPSGAQTRRPDGPDGRSA